MRLEWWLCMVLRWIKKHMAQAPFPPPSPQEVVEEARVLIKKDKEPRYALQYPDGSLCLGVQLPGLAIDPQEATAL